MRMAEALNVQKATEPEGHPFTDFDAVTPETDIGRLNLSWSEHDLPEELRTKHVNRLHPYLGKYVPQLVELFLRKYRPKTVLDPFAGSGTTLVTAMELGIDSTGYDVSPFNCLLMKVKTDTYDIRKLRREAKGALEIARRQLKPSIFFEDKPFEMPHVSAFLREWFHPKALRELLCYREQIQHLHYADFFKIVLSRAARSARLTTHFDLDFPKKPTTEPYKCYKHHDRICKPTTHAGQFLERYTWDAIERVEEFSKVRRDVSVKVHCEDARKSGLPRVEMAMTSPPYVGLIDYHEQHRYAFELLELPDNRELEIGAAANGNSARAVETYKDDVVAVARNVWRALPKGGRFVVVATDKRGLYPSIAEEAGVQLEQLLQRNVKRRTERRSKRLFENIFVWQK